MATEIEVSCPLVPPGHPWSAVQPQMSDIKHTPGPWTTKELQVYAEDGNGSTLAHVYDPSRDHDHSEAEANALLIAAAPELLMACKAAYRNLEMSEAYVLVDVLKAAIAKAEGKL